METIQKIKCPKCGTEIDANAVLYEDITRKLECEYAEKNSQTQKDLKAKLAEVEKYKSDLAARESGLESKISDGVSEKLKVEKKKLERELRKQLENESSDTVKSLQEELNKKTEQIKELNQARAEIERLKREKDEVASKITLAKEKELNNKLNQEREKISKQMHDENYLKEEENKKTISDLTAQIADKKTGGTGVYAAARRSTGTRHRKRT